MRTLLLAFLVACGGSSDPVVDDAGPDVPRDAGNCFGAALVRTCLAALPTAPVSLTGTLDTTNAPECFADQGWCVIAGTTVSLSTLRITGSRPAVFVATTTITVDGVLDAASRRTGNTVEVAAAADSTACVPAQTPSQGGGGPGGSFGGRGGNGGIGSLNSAESAFVTSITAFRGGCSGMQGANVGGAGGSSGGAVYLIARTSIVVNGSINASGAAGAGGQAGGGGGGGSGGFIGLEAPQVMVTGSVFANGGGAGEGSGSTPGGQGTNPVAATSPAVGGSGTAGGDGGAGSAGTSKVGTRGGDAATGGGGGGGGAGVTVVIPTQVTGGTISPLPI